MEEAADSITLDRNLQVDCIKKASVNARTRKSFSSGLLSQDEKNDVRASEPERCKASHAARYGWLPEVDEA